MEAVRATGGEFAATWRNSEGEIVGGTFGGTMCWMPLKPWSLRITRDDWTGIVPCGECPGCLEFYRRRLADRLCRKFGSAHDAEPSTRRRRGSATDASLQEKNTAGGDVALDRQGQQGRGRASCPSPLFLIRIYAPLEHHAALSRKLHRRPRLELEPGFLRLGATSFAVIARVKVFPPLFLGGARLKTRTEAIRLSRGRRAWRSATAGMLVAREAYGAQVNRFYLRGLAPAERERWNVLSQSGAKGYSRASDPRVWKSNRLVLVPPSVWALGRADRRTIRRDLGRCTDPEGVARVMAMVSELAARKSQSSLLGPAARPVLTIEQVKEHYARMAKRKVAASVSEPSSISSSPPSEGGGYLSSVHLGGSDPPVAAPPKADHVDMSPWSPKWIAALPEDALTELSHKQYLHRRERKLLDQHLDRLQSRLKGG